VRAVAREAPAGSEANQQSSAQEQNDDDKDEEGAYSAGAVAPTRTLTGAVRRAVRERGDVSATVARAVTA
jgi:hypothetical protein